ncbi:MAG: AAA family ATPase [Deltaproteobacteria bacterium]|nr:AAA family ATPase [Deltaproteobacteria bacterium]
MVTINTTLPSLLGQSSLGVDTFAGPAAGMSNTLTEVGVELADHGMSEFITGAPLSPWIMGSVVLGVVGLTAGIIGYSRYHPKRMISARGTGPAIAINGKTYSNFDGAYQMGNRDLEGSYKMWRRNLWASTIGGATVSMGAFTYLGISSSANHFQLGFGALIGGWMGIMLGGFISIDQIRKNDGFYTRGYLKKQTHVIDYPPLTRVADTLTVRDVAAWVNVLYDTARRATEGQNVANSTAKGPVEWFEDVLQSGLKVHDKALNKDWNLVEAMGEEQVRSFRDFALQSPNGVQIFRTLAKYNPVARKMEQDGDLMKDLHIDWNQKNWCHPNAVEAVQWLVNHGNTDILRAFDYWVNSWNSPVARIILNGLKLPSAVAAPSPQPPGLPAVGRAGSPTGGEGVNAAATLKQTLVDANATVNRILDSLEGPSPQPPGLPAVGRAGSPTSGEGVTVVSAVEASADALNAALEKFLGQPRATEWLDEMRSALMVDQARIEAGGTPKISLNAAFTGPDGVGKEMAAKLYGEIAFQSGRIKNAMQADVEIVRVADLSSMDTTIVSAKVEELRQNMSSGTYKPVVFLGTADEVQAFLKAHKLAALVKHSVSFDELDGKVLAAILEKMAEEEKFSLSDETKARVQRILQDRRGGSHMARSLLDLAIRQQAKRLAPEIRKGGFDKTKLTTLEGADFASAHAAMESKALLKLEKMVGLKGVKESLRGIVALLNQNFEREHRGLKTTRPVAHALFIGKPGTGKTTTAEIYANVLKETGFLPKGQCIKTSASELVGKVVGEAESLALKMLEQAKGGVLFVDEAHNLVTSEFGKKALETILKYMEDHNSEIVVIFGGYPDQMEKMLDHDPGLRRRFPQKIVFEDYTIDELGEILDGMVGQIDYILDPKARLAAIEFLKRQQSAKDFGNAGAVRNLFEAAVVRQSRRLQAIRAAGNGLDDEDYKRLIADDFEGKEAPDPNAALKELDNFMGLEKVKKQFREMLNAINFAKARGGEAWEGVEPYFIFSGPPGTGKTTMAQTMGKVFKGMGLLPTDKVVEVNAIDLIAGFVGQTGGQTKEIFERALGGVLFIDEIGGLANSTNAFTPDAINQLLTLLEKYKGKLVVVVAGYDDKVNAFLQLDEGLSSRFSNPRLNFESLSVKDAADLFEMRIQEKQPKIVLSAEAKAALPELIAQLSAAPNWANGRDIRTLVAKTINKQGNYWADNDGKVDINTIPVEVLREAVQALVQKKIEDAEIATSRPVDTLRQAAATQSAQSPAPAPAPVRAELVEAQHSFALHTEQATKELNLSPMEAWAQMTSSDPDSALAQAVAKKSGKRAEEVAQELKKNAEAIAAQPAERGWICMHCGSTNPSCPYKELPPKEKAKHNGLKRRS